MCILFTFFNNYVIICLSITQEREVQNMELSKIFEELCSVASCSSSLLDALGNVSNRGNIHFGNSKELTCSKNALLVLDPAQEQFVFFQRQNDDYILSSSLNGIDCKHHFAVIETKASKNFGNKHIARICLH